MLAFVPYGTRFTFGAGFVSLRLRLASSVGVFIFAEQVKGMAPAVPHRLISLRLRLAS
ncbi:hypothetical protein [Paenibacillus lignilyticus]|uniref:Uncharacterized protein n=1 Tax=Paenibacillus lignilyticus TaxID=1172615 RepID=A0ABS5CFB7_9BACL|nr:hypothetical protein [Paenibacillus lignilyticus]MBP3964546.1 hypothetical protein [Paenibacillus lignilyticus]